MELSSDFSRYLSSLQPDEDAVAAAKAAHEKVRERLRTDDDTKDAHKDTFLSGSYARHTAIHDINDVDVICIVDIDHTITEPEVVLSWLQGALSKYYKETRLQGRSIGASAAKGVWLDIVPGTPKAADDGPLWIPDRDASQWVEAHPKGQISAATAKNKATDGFYVQTVKLLKSWRDRFSTEKSKPKSYILETLVHQSIGTPTSHAQAVVNVLEGIQANYGWYRGSGIVPTISDPGYSTVNVAKRWESGDFDAFLDRVKPAAETARKALDNTDETESRKLWRQIFGSTFGA
ncbi:SMODS domain-containing nucleotidyltransferase [Bradyrhizobium niftali]|uniref:Nucleotidyltransferase n=1 Tax=Bradyrhizobium niftali TaxID=2560055 RepID=A0A4Y9LZE0_9BRAD|nr:nucleotidyltransferase [Bradyrhizobium niftali]TFV48274.1 nucleotidyltransferase [Bradyrhizobium niftali]